MNASHNPTDAREFRIIPRWIMAAMLAVNVSSAEAAVPEIRNVSLRGLQTGATTTIVIDGTDLWPSPRLVMAIPIAHQHALPSSTATRLEIEVTLDAETQPGLYNLWLASAQGMSNPVVIAVDGLPERAFTLNAESLPVALHGAVGGSAKLRTSFSGKAGQPIVCEVEAQRLGGKLRSVLHLYDAGNKHLAWSMPSPMLHGDTRLETVLPADGQYTLELHDLQYAAPAANFFRLKIGTWQYADLVYPPAVERSKTATVHLIGNLPADMPLTFTDTHDRQTAAAPWLDKKLSSGFRPSVLISDIPELLEIHPSEGLQQFPSVPSAVSGRLLEPGEEDRYRLAVQPGQKLRFEVYADRLGSAMDAILELQNEQKGQLALNDDANGSSDALIDYTVPADLNAVVVILRDANGGGGHRCIYRIIVRSQTSTSDTRDFQLKLEQQRQSISAGDRQVVRVIAERSGYMGPIELAFDQLPDGIQVQGNIIPSGAASTLLTLHGAGTDVAHALTSLRGIGAEAEQPLVRYASDATHPLNAIQPWLSSEVAVALAQPSGIDFATDWEQFPEDVKLVLGAKFAAPIRSKRPVGFDGPVRLTLVTSQVAPLVNGTPDPNRTMRLETGPTVELPGDVKAQQTSDAQVAAAKVLAEATQSQTIVAQTGAKAKAEADAGLKTAMAQVTTATETVTTAASQAKAAADANEKEVQGVTNAVAQLTETVAKTEKSNAAAVVAMATAASEAATHVLDAVSRQVAAEKTAKEAAAKVQVATAAMTVAQNVVTEAEALLNAATAAAATADADAAAKVLDVTAKLQAAEQDAVAAAMLAKNDGQFNILVPANLDKGGYEVAFLTELLSRDRSTVVARSYTRVRRINTLNPIILSLKGSNRLEGKIDPTAGATVKLTGNVARLAGMNQDVTVSLVGLPAGIAVPTAIVKVDQTDFELEIKFPANMTPVDVKGVQLFATGKFEPNAALEVRSEDVAVEIYLLMAETPAGK